MKAAIQLENWFRDSRAQRESAERCVGVGERLRAFPPLSRLRARLDRSQIQSAAEVLALAREFVDDRGALPAIVDELVRAARTDPFFRPPLNLVLDSVHSGLVLFDHPHLTLTLALLDADAVAAKRAGRIGGASIIFSGRQSFFHFVRSGGARLSLWEAQAIEPGFTAARSGRCRLVGHHRICDGETLLMDGRCRTFIVDEALNDLVYVQADVHLQRAPLTAEYDSASLRLIGASSTDEASSRTQMMLALLRTMERADAVPVFEELLAAEHFYARWQTMRELLALDAEAALPHLRAMADSDPHPEVRSAAARTLDDFFPEHLRNDEDARCPA